MPREIRRDAVAAIVAVAMFLVAPSAMAAQRFASPTGSGTACSSAAPCGIVTAFSGAGNGDELILASGDYGPVPSSLYTVPNEYAHGVAGQPPPRINLGASSFVNVTGAGARLSYVQLDGVSGAPLDVNDGAEADQVYVHGSVGDACLVYGTLIDAVCWTSASNSTAISGATGNASTPVLRNVTAEATASGGKGIEYHTSSSGSLTITAVNVIARSGGTDIQVQADSPGAVTLNIDHSNFGTGTVLGNNSHINSTAKQSAAPAFVNAAAGDFHEAPGSPTINAGATSPANGAFDFEGNPRVIDGATDIGADEFDPFAGVLIASRKAKAKKGRAKVNISCPANAPPPCAGNLVLFFKQGKKTKKAGYGQFSIQPGATKAVKVRITRTALKLLGRRGKLRTQASATATDGAGVARTVTGSLKLKSG